MNQFCTVLDTVESYVRVIVLSRGLQNVFCKGLENKYFRLHRPHTSLFHLYVYTPLKM